MNPVAGLPFAPSAPEAVDDFHAVLRQRGLICTVRREMGRDIQAACGSSGRRSTLPGEPAAPSRFASRGGVAGAWRAEAG